MTTFAPAYQSPHTPTVYVGLCDQCAQIRSFTNAEERDRFERHEHGSAKC